MNVLFSYLLILFFHVFSIGDAELGNRRGRLRIIVKTTDGWVKIRKRGEHKYYRLGINSAWISSCFGR